VHDVLYDAESVCLTQGQTKERPTLAGTRWRQSTWHTKMSL